MIKRITHCAHWGAFTVLVEGERIVGIEPFADDPAPSPIIQSVKEWLNPARRIAQPMVRAGWLSARERSDRTGRGRDEFVPVSWEEAARLVASEIGRVREVHGNASIFGGSYGWTSAGRFHHAASQVKRMLNLVGGYTGHRDTYSIGAGAVLARHVMGNDADYVGRGSSLDSISNNTGLLLVFGALTPRTAQNEAGGMGRHTLELHLRQLMERGARVILISPRRDDIPSWVNAEWWPILPGTDAALVLGLAGELVACGRQDDDFLRRCCSGSDRFLAYVRGDTDGIPKSAEWAAQITGLDATKIRSMARQLPDFRTFISMSWSLQRAVYGEQPWWAAIALASMIGQIGLPGGGVGFGYGSLGGVGATVPLAQAPALSQGRSACRSFIPVARIADMLLNPGAPFTYEGDKFNFPDVRLVYWAGGNPFHHHQDLNRLAKAWEQPETIVVQEPLWTPTARRADIVLPANTSLERNDIGAGSRSEYFIAMQQAVPSLGHSRSDYDIARHIANELGVEEAFSEGRDEMEWLGHLYDSSAQAALERLQVKLPSFSEFWMRGYTKVPQQEGYVHLAKFREDPAGNPMRTESGRIVLFSEKLESLAYPDCPPHPSWLEPAEWGQGGDSKFPFRLLSPQPQSRLHSQIDYGSLSQASKVAGREAVTIHPADAAQLGLQSGDVARLWNNRGQCLAGVHVSDDVRTGVVTLPTGAWYEPTQANGSVLEVAGNPNVLTPDVASSAFSGGCSAHTCRVAIERFEDQSAL